MDAFEAFYEFSRENEEYELDELALAIPALMLCLGIFGCMKTRALGKMNRTLRESNRKLAEAEREIRKLAQVRDEFIAMACHELKTPLNGIIQSVQLAEMSDSAEEARQVFQLAGAGAENLKLLVDDILEFSRLKHGEGDVDTRPFDVRAALESIRDIIRPEVERRGLQFIMAVDPDVPKFVTAHEGWIRLVVLNILGNSVKFTGSGTIALNCAFETLDGDCLAITVSDTGRGIPESELERIFQPYEQGEAAPRRRRGVGLGLYIVKELLGKMDARITVQSTPGKGSEFSLLFPVKSVL